MSNSVSFSFGGSHYRIEHFDAKSPAPRVELWTRVEAKQAINVLRSALQGYQRQQLRSHLVDFLRLPTSESGKLERELAFRLGRKVGGLILLEKHLSHGLRSLAPVPEFVSPSFEPFEQYFPDPICDASIPRVPEAKIGQCEYYQWRHDNFRERHVGCGHLPPDYYIDFGLKYCKRFASVRPKMSEHGQAWLARARTALQRHLEQALQADPTIELDSATFKAAAFGTHPDAYVEAGVCGVYSPLDHVLIVWAIGAGWTDPATYSQAFDTGGQCLQEGKQAIEEVVEDINDAASAAAELIEVVDDAVDEAKEVLRKIEDLVNPIPKF